MIPMSQFLNGHTRSLSNEGMSNRQCGVFSSVCFSSGDRYAKFSFRLGHMQREMKL